MFIEIRYESLWVPLALIVELIPIQIARVKFLVNFYLEEQDVKWNILACIFCALFLLACGKPGTANNAGELRPSSQDYSPSNSRKIDIYLDGKVIRFPYGTTEAALVEAYSPTCMDSEGERFCFVKINEKSAVLVQSESGEGLCELGTEMQAGIKDGIVISASCDISAEMGLWITDELSKLTQPIYSHQKVLRMEINKAKWEQEEREIEIWAFTGENIKGGSINTVTLFVRRRNSDK